MFRYTTTDGRTDIYPLCLDLGVRGCSCVCVNRGALFVSPKSIDSFGKRDTREKERGRGKTEGENRGCFYFFSPFFSLVFIYIILESRFSNSLNISLLHLKNRTTRESCICSSIMDKKIWLQKGVQRKYEGIVALNRFSPSSREEKTTTTRINFYKVLRKLNDTANSPLSWVVALFYNRTLLQELRTFSKTRQRTLQLKEADTLPDNGPINLSWNF